MSENIYNNQKKNSSAVTIGIIGLGTVGTVLSRIFYKAGIPFYVYDKLCEEAESNARIMARADTVNARLISLSALIQKSDYIFSAVTTQVAAEVAKKCSSYLKHNQIFIDFNSTSPDQKRLIQQIIISGEADFAEGVILNAVNSDDTTLHLLTGGTKGQEIATFLKSVGLEVKWYSEEVGKASMFKMLRSIFSKGVEVLLLEMMITAKKAGLEKEMWQEITSYVDSKPFATIGDTWIKSHPLSSERRFHEMQQVVETMEELGVSPILTKATLSYFEQSVSLNLSSFPVETRNSTEAVINLIASQLESKLIPGEITE
jgi:3-hydroxyisobutyrate dehydrogenase-like beta-hydroxyacid dehydrogenase